MLTDIILNKLIEYGRTENFSELDNLFPNWQEYQHFTQTLMDEIKATQGGGFIHYYEIFAVLGDKYDFDTLGFLIKGLTIAEKKTRMNGSVSPVIPLYKKLVEKAGLRYLVTGDKVGIHLLTKHLEEHPHKGVEDITHWLLSNSDNDYLPFGTSTLSSKTIPEIRIEVENWMQRQRQLAAREEIEKHEKEHNDKTEEQRKFREHLNSLSLSKLLQTINADKQRPIYFYASELSKIENTSLTAEDKDLIKDLLKKFKQAETGQFKRLKAMLISTVEPKS